jgi:GT2 family glycosyltransferase
MDLSVIVVNYNTCRLLSECLNSLFAETQGIECEVIVVDNGSSDGSREMLQRDFRQVTSILNTENRGFAAANNQALRIARGEYFLLLNSDTKVLDGAIVKTHAFLEKHPEASIIGCKLLNPDGTLQRSCRSFPSVWNLFVESFFLYKVLSRTELFGSYYMTFFDHNTVRSVDVVMGAFMMIRREVCEKVGLLDESYFMYTEETDFCYRARQSGFATYFFPSAEIVHYGGGSIESADAHFGQLHVTQLLFLRKHFSGLRKHAAIMLKFLGIIFRVPVYAMLWLFTLDRRWLSKSQSYAKVLFNSR